MVSSLFCAALWASLTSTSLTGCGKSTLLKFLAGRLDGQLEANGTVRCRCALCRTLQPRRALTVPRMPPSYSQVYLNGLDRKALAASGRPLHADIAYVPQDPSLCEEQSVYEALLCHANLRACNEGSWRLSDPHFKAARDTRVV